MGQASSKETYELIDFPDQELPPPQLDYHEPGESGPDILERPELQIEIISGSNHTINVRYANSKYPVRITWFKRTEDTDRKIIGEQENSAREGCTSLKLREVSTERNHDTTYEVVITDTYYKYKTDGCVCTILVRNRLC